jgi:hypothetical protein
MNINEQRNKVFQKLYELMKDCAENKYNYPEFTINGMDKEICLAIFIDYLKNTNHPFIHELDQVGLLEYYDSVLKLMRLHNKENQ